MSGLRIGHPTLRSCTVRVPHPGGPGRAPKDYLLRLDADGTTIVSTTVWGRLEEARTAGLPHGLTLLNVVERPPDQTIGDVPAGPALPTWRVERDALRQLTPPGVRPHVGAARHG